MGKINDQRLFPADTSSVSLIATSNGSPSSVPGREWVGKSSGFAESFEADIKSIYRQMFRCYAHIYHCHWLDPFYHISAYKELNTCFVHFVNVGKLFDLLLEKELKPMQPLIDIWLSKGLLSVPVTSKPETVSVPA